MDNVQKHNTCNNIPSSQRLDLIRNLLNHRRENYESYK
jgi:hypothetical protein